MNPDMPRRRVLFVNQLMSRNVVTIAAEATLLEASKIFADRRFRHIPVVDAAGALLGILSDRDLLRYAVNDNWRDQPVSAIMTSPVLLASSDTEMREVARIMFEERVGCMPIIEADNSLVGIITRSDVLRTLLVQAPLELWH
jgi:CBS domain-containing protein